jgi:rubrerythrin
MCFILTCAELDKLWESAEVSESYKERAELIKEIKASGRYYDFDKYSDKQLYRIWEKIPKNISKGSINKPTTFHKICKNCNNYLSDNDTCPLCDEGDEELLFI